MWRGVAAADLRTVCSDCQGQSWCGCQLKNYSSWCCELVDHQAVHHPPRRGALHDFNTVMDTSRLQEFLGGEYTSVVRHPIAEAFAECFQQEERLKTLTPA